MGKEQLERSIVGLSDLVTLITEGERKMGDTPQRSNNLQVIGPKDLASPASPAAVNQSLGPEAFNFSSAMKERLGPLGRFMIGFEERRVARDEIKQVLMNELRAHTELMLHRARLDLQYMREVDQAAHLQRTRKVEEFLLAQEADVQHKLNEMIDKFEDVFTKQYVDVKRKLKSELDVDNIDQEIYEMRAQRALARYESAMDKTLNDMNMIIDNHKTNLQNTLKTFTAS